MPTVYHCSPTNSTFFTTCCNVAILDHEDFCGKCGEEIESKGRSARWEAAFGPKRRAIQERHRKAGRDPNGCLMCGKPLKECYC